MPGYPDKRERTGRLQLRLAPELALEWAAFAGQNDLSNMVRCAVATLRKLNPERFPYARWPETGYPTPASPALAIARSTPRRRPKAARRPERRHAAVGQRRRGQTKARRTPRRKGAKRS